MKAIFYSNLTKILAEKLKENLFFKKSKKSSYIFVPNRFVKEWLMKNFSQDPTITVSFDQNFITIKNFLNFFQNKIEIPNEKRFLSFLDLYFVIRKKILQNITSPKTKYLELKNYLIKDKQISEKRLNSLTNELCKDFLKYSIFANSLDLETKRKNLWQAELFYEIFYQDNNALCFRDLQKINLSFEDSSFHFFAIDYLPPLYFDFINKLKNVYHYLQSPCSFFWEDILSDFERQKMQKYFVKQQVHDKTIQELDTYLKDRNSFLANMEKLKRAYLSTMQNYDSYEIFEEYQISDDQEVTLLKQFQKDILNLTNREERVFHFEKKDDSLKLHIANSKYREVQVLYSNILKILNKNDDIALKDITVIAPNIDDYLPFIHMIFSNQKEKLNYKIENISLDGSHLFTGIQKLLLLAKSNWEKEEVLSLFENPLFQKSYRLTKEEIKLIFAWIEKANISWGLDEDHINTVLEKSPILHSVKNKTFEEGFSKILFGLVFLFNAKYIDSTFKFDYFEDSIDLSKSNILDKILKIFISLKNDLEIIKKNKRLTLFEWAHFFNTLISNHFSLDFETNDFESFIEKKAFDDLRAFFENLKKIANKFKEDKYEFEVIFDHVKKHLKRSKTHFNYNDQMAINFSSFEAALLPSKAIFVIGLEEKSLEIKSQNFLNLSSNIKNPKDNDLIRSKFLQSLLSAEKYCILSYSSKNGSLFDSSILLQELVAYLDNSYQISQKKPSAYFIKSHVSFSFHEDNFTKKEIGLSYQDFMAAKSFYHQNEKTNSRFRTDLKNDIIKEIPDVIDLKSLQKLSKNPIKFYLNNGLNIYLDDQKELSDFNLSFLDKFLMKKAFLDTNIEDILFSYDKKGLMPFGIFSEIEKRNIIQSYHEFHQNLKNLQIDKSKIFSIDLNLTCKSFTKIDENNIQMPAIDVLIDNKIVKITGSLQNISNQGLLVNLDDKISSLIQIWADILIFYKLKLDVSKNIVFLKSNKIKSFEIEKIDDYLSKYIQYYLNSKGSLSFMIKAFSEHILKSDESSLKKAINNTSKSSYRDVYLTWVLRHFEKLEAKNIIKNQANYLKSIFEPILENFSGSF